MATGRIHTGLENTTIHRWKLDKWCYAINGQRKANDFKLFAAYSRRMAWPLQQAILDTDDLSRPS